MTWRSTRHSTARKALMAALVILTLAGAATVAGCGGTSSGGNQAEGSAKGAPAVSEATLEAEAKKREQKALAEEKKREAQSIAEAKKNREAAKKAEEAACHNRLTCRLSFVGRTTYMLGISKGRARQPQELCAAMQFKESKSSSCKRRSRSISRLG